MEILVTVAIISIALLITVIEANKTFKRQNLAAAAQEIENVLQQAPTYGQKRNRQTIIRVTGRSTGVDAKIEVFSDENESGAIEGADRLMLTYTMPPTVSFFACGTVSAVGSTCAGNQNKIQSANWSNDAVDNTARLLRIDYQGRTVNPATSSQIAGVATLNISLVDMADTGGLTPGTTYQIRINPVWHVSTNRTLWGP